MVNADARTRSRTPRTIAITVAASPEPPALFAAVTCRKWKLLSCDVDFNSVVDLWSCSEL